MATSLTSIGSCVSRTDSRDVLARSATLADVRPTPAFSIAFAVDVATVLDEPLALDRRLVQSGGDDAPPIREALAADSLLEHTSRIAE